MTTNNYMMLNGQRISFTEEQVKQLQAVLSAGSKKLSDIEAGATFKIGEHEFFVLEHCYKCGVRSGTMVLYKGLLEDDLAFGESNNFADDQCVVRRRLEKFAKELETLVGNNLITHTVDLTSDDGLDDYGVTAAFVSLLTTDQYRRYVNIIDKYKTKKWWWLATPFSTPTHEDSECVKCVSPRGFINFGYFSISRGVRPFCIFDSDIFVSV